MKGEDTIGKVRHAMTKQICLKDVVKALAEYAALNNIEGASTKDRLVNTVKILMLERTFSGLLELIQQTSENVLFVWVSSERRAASRPAQTD